MPAFDIDLPATLQHLGEARRRLGVWLADEVPDAAARGDLLAVAGEFFLHVVFRTGGLGRARVVAERWDDGVRLSVTAADGCDTVRSMATPADPLAVGAIGRRLVEACCDEVTVASDGAGTVSAQCFRSVASGRV